MTSGSQYRKPPGVGGNIGPRDEEMRSIDEQSKRENRDSRCVAPPERDMILIRFLFFFFFFWILDQESAPDRP